MLHVPGPEERRQHERWKEAQRRLCSRAARVLPPGLARIKAERAFAAQMPKPTRDMLIVSSAAMVEETASDPDTEVNVDFIVDPFRWKRIIREVCEKHRVSATELMGHRRFMTFVIARHEAFYRLTKETTMSLPQIGRIMGGFDHASVIHGSRRHAERMAEAALDKARAGQ